MTPETLYLRLYDEIKTREALETRVKRLENFLQSKYPGDLAPEFAGDHGELGAAPDLNPIALDFSAPLVGELPQDKTGLVDAEAQ